MDSKTRACRWLNDEQGATSPMSADRFADEESLTKEFEEVRRQALETACRSSCYYCAEGSPYVDPLSWSPDLWHQNPTDPRVSSRCDASRIRSLMSAVPQEGEK